VRTLLITLAITLATTGRAAADVPPPPPAAAEPAEESGDRLQAAGWALLVAGAAALAAAATLSLRAAADHEAWKASRDPWDKPRLKARGESRALAADVVGGAGLAAAVAGCVVVLTF